jgi:hypothetical protein
VIAVQRVMRCNRVISGLRVSEKGLLLPDPMAPPIQLFPPRRTFSNRRPGRRWYRSFKPEPPARAPSARSGCRPFGGCWQGLPWPPATPITDACSGASRPPTFRRRTGHHRRLATPRRCAHGQHLTPHQFHGALFLAISTPLRLLFVGFGRWFRLGFTGVL